MADPTLGRRGPLESLVMYCRHIHPFSCGRHGPEHARPPVHLLLLILVQWCANGEGTKINVLLVVSPEIQTNCRMLNIFTARRTTLITWKRKQLVKMIARDTRRGGIKPIYDNNETGRKERIAGLRTKSYVAHFDRGDRARRSYVCYSSTVWRYKK